MKDGGSHRHGTGGHGHQEKGEKNRDYPFKLIFSIIEQGDSTVNLEVTVAWSKVKNFFLKSTSNGEKFGHCSRQSTKSTTNVVYAKLKNSHRTNHKRLKV